MVVNQALLAGVLGVALIGLVGYNLVHVPQRRAADLTQQQIVEEQKHQQAQKDVAALLAEIGEYRTQLSPEADPAWLVQHVVDQARESEVEFTMISQHAPEGFGEFTRLSATFEISATYHQLGALLDQLEQSGRFIHVDHLEIRTSQYEDEPASVDMEVSTLHLPFLGDQFAVQ